MTTVYVLVEQFDSMAEKLINGVYSSEEKCKEAMKQRVEELNEFAGIEEIDLKKVSDKMFSSINYVHQVSESTYSSIQCDFEVLTFNLV